MALAGGLLLQAHLWLHVLLGEAHLQCSFIHLFIGRPPKGLHVPNIALSSGEE